MHQMNILITNDDGLEAAGLQRLAQALHEAGARIYVCAPHMQRSATAHGITMNRPIEVTEAEMPIAEIAWKTTGLPADCVKIAMEFLRRQGVKIDMVYSGINHGGNLGTDTLYSGTVAAALEGSLCGVPSVAVSVDSHMAQHFEYACELAVNAAKAMQSQLEQGTADPRVVLNINTPNLPREQIKGLRYTTLGPREYNEIFVPAHMDSEEARLRRDAAQAAAKAGVTSDGTKASADMIYAFDPADAGVAGVAVENTAAAAVQPVMLPGAFRYSGTPVVYEGLPETYDVIANQDGYASITPIQTDLTAYAMLDEIRTWNLG